MSTAPKFIPQYTVDDYRRWEGDWELWSGIAVAMTPSPFGRHSRLLVKLATALETGVQRAGCDAVVLAEIDWIVADDTVLRPDLLIVCGTEPERHVEKVPALVAEILSDSTRERDLVQKKEYYREQGVRWYLTVDSENAFLDARQLNDNGQYVTVSSDGPLAIDICEDCSFEVSAESLFR